MIKIKYRSLFFFVLISVIGALTVGYAYKKYNDEGNILGFRIEKVHQIQNPPNIPTITPFFKPNSISNQVGELKAAPSNSPVPSQTPVPEVEIRIQNYPQTVKLNENAAFTWEVTGPQSTTPYTAIVGAKESKKGLLDRSIGLEKTPYRVLTREFISGNYNIPLVFVGNTNMPEYGDWYIRGLAVINGQNYWTSELSLTVQ